MLGRTIDSALDERKIAKSDGFATIVGQRICAALGTFVFLSLAKPAAGVVSRHPFGRDFS